MMLDSLSKNLKDAANDMKNARWRYDGAIISGDATGEEIHLLWEEYSSFQREVLKIEDHLKRIEEAKVNVLKARWWLDIGVHSNEYTFCTLPLIYPFDSLHAAEMRRADAIQKAKGDYDAAKRIFDDLTISEEDRSFIKAVNEAYSLQNKTPQRSILRNSVRAGEMLRRHLPMPRD
jgi:hypothetical protein